MKKIIFSLLMLSAMFMIASCGSKSNSGEATEEQANEVTFTDPAITYDKGVDMTSYFSAESLTKPALRESEGKWIISSNVRLKLVKKIDPAVSGCVRFEVHFCDENGSVLENAWVESGNTLIYSSEFKNWSEGTVITLEAKSMRGEYVEGVMQETLDKVKKIEVSVDGSDLEFPEPKEDKE